ncbi:hypothetical protein [Verrucomicrobium spinosum]|uniref:hypothetical protein n=1 Tax=Verrucomicrobium spinosum TaxID=2736 RepID=UPI0009466E08|nr:hypothetical protein [Verrucomicrobium spinosum]
MQQAPWVGWVVIGGNTLVWICLALFGAPFWIIVGDGILCLLLLALQIWMQIGKPEQRLILSDSSLTFVGILGETTLSFSEITSAEYKPHPGEDTDVPSLFLSDGLGNSIVVHPGFLQLPEGVIPFVEARLRAHGKRLERHRR